MLYAGCDLGSTVCKAVVLDGSGGRFQIVASAYEPSGFDPDETAASTLGRAALQCGLSGYEGFGAICATGYGRASVSFIPQNVSEITCHARGAHWVAPRTRTIIDVGGQDVKAISLQDDGSVADFAMNDKCAAGTGKFFEAMARTLRCTVEELGELALHSESPVAISSQCSVFAESEVVTYINRQVPREDIAGGIHDAIARRLLAMVQRVGLREAALLTGGCAKNLGLRASLERALKIELSACPIDPQFTGALGAALSAGRSHTAC